MKRWWDHRSLRRRLPALAAGDPDPALRAHVGTCRTCAHELARLEQALALVASDPLRTASPPIPVAALRARVFARLDEPREPGSWRALAWTAPVVIALIALGWPRSSGVEAPAPRVLTDDTTFLRRMERQLAREQAARYLNDAQDLLVSVASAREDCERDRVDLAAESRRGRELLARRALLVDTTGGSLASARPVLDVVDVLVADVAGLPACARRDDLEALHSEIEQRQVMLKISLLTRELTG